ncbi:hypothetical protein BT69DRAFT_1279677, partial [Atractiella rhizophila]
MQIDKPSSRIIDGIPAGGKRGSFSIYLFNFLDLSSVAFIETARPRTPHIRSSNATLPL